MGGQNRETLAPPPSPAPLPFFLGTLICWRWMLPPESSVLGETVWVTQLTLLLPLAWLWQQWRIGSNRILWTKLETLFAIVVLGHWLSAGWMLTTGGNVRSALNLCWEWTALGVLLFALRQTVRTREDRHELGKLVLSMGVCFAGLGLWQSTIQHRQVFREYTSQRSEIDALTGKASSGTISRIEAERLRELEFDFRSMQVPLDERGRMVFEQRLRDGAQPTGRWALTNTFAGWIAVLLIFAVGGLIGLDQTRISRVGWAAMSILFGIVLWLTHSRTALVGTMFGIALLILYRVRHQLSGRSGLILGSVVGLVVVLLILGLIFASEAGDLVESNYALRSLEFRLQYWQGTLAMLADRPIFGTGPGNFRQHYLSYKLPESSEQIADPHQFVLDLWSNGGLLAAGAWMLFLSMFSKRAWVEIRNSTRIENGRENIVSPGFLSSYWMVGAEAALIGLMLGTLLREGYLDGQVVAFAIALPLVENLIGRLWKATRFLPLASAVGVVVLSIHLLGAGGIEMPGVVMSILLLVVLATDARWANGEEPRSWKLSSKQAILTVVLTLGISVLGYYTLTRPVSRSSFLVQEANAKLGVDQDVRGARETYRQAADVDPWDPEPWRSLASLEFGFWQNKKKESGAFERGIEALEAAYDRDPWSGKDHLILARMSWVRFQHNGEPESAVRSMEYAERAVARMPGEEQALVLLAESAAASGFPEKAVSAAKKARKISEESRSKGHWERILDDEIVRRLEQIERGEVVSP